MVITLWDRSIGVVEEQGRISCHADRRLCEAHIFREHNQEADHWVNLGAEAETKIIDDKGKNTENWKAVRGVWDGSTKTNGRSGCGVVIKGVDRDNRITIRQVAVPLSMCTAMAAEVVGFCILTGIMDLVLGKNISVKAINQCIDAVIKITLRCDMFVSDKSLRAKSTTKMSM